MVSELEEGLKDTMELAKKRLVTFDPAKLLLVSLDRLNNWHSTDVEIDGSGIEKKLDFNMLVLSFTLYLAEILYHI